MAARTSTPAAAFSATGWRPDQPREERRNRGRAIFLGFCSKLRAFTTLKPPSQHIRFAVTFVSLARCLGGHAYWMTLDV
jgi:hypothetical protein